MVWLLLIVGAAGIAGMKLWDAWDQEKLRRRIADLERRVNQVID